MSKTLTLSHRRFFTKAAKALVESYRQSIKLNDALYDVGIDVANYTEPAYLFLEKFIADYYDDKYGNLIDMLFTLAEYGSVDIGDNEIIEITTVEEIYDYFFKENK